MISFYTICMRIFATLYEDICHFVWRYSPLFMRIFAYKKIPWSLVKFFQLILEGNIWYHFTQFVWWYSPLCMRIFATLKTRRKLGQVSFHKPKTSGIVTGNVLFSYLPICFPCPQYQKQFQKSFVKLTQPMRNDVINMSGAWDKDKIWVELSLWPSVLWSGILTTELQRTPGKMGDIKII